MDGRARTLDAGTTGDTSLPIHMRWAKSMRWGGNIAPGAGVKIRIISDGREPAKKITGVYNGQHHVSLRRAP